MAFKKVFEGEENIAKKHRDVELARRKVFKNPKSVIAIPEPLKEG